MLPVEPTTTRLDAEQCAALIARGEIRPDDRVELLEGVVASMAPPGSPHANAIARINFRDPEPRAARWMDVRPAYRGERIDLAAPPGLFLSIEDPLPRD